jgi:acetolactate synthase-1/2/3 large subunit
MKLSDFVFQFVKEKGIDTVFTVSGGGCMHLIDSLGKSGIKYICNHHEQACSIAAEAYFRTSGKPGCVLVTTGPGGTNALTGVLCAYQDSIPMIVFSGQVPSEQLSSQFGCRQFGQQEFDIVSTVKTMSKYSKTILNPSNIKYELEYAWDKATSGRPGPVWLDIPLDIQSAQIEVESLKSFVYEKNNSKTDDIFQTLESIKSISEILKLINSNMFKRPVVLIGNGIKSSGTIEKFKKFIFKYKLPVFSGPHSAVDIINHDYENYAGKVGILGNKISNQIIQQSDLVISLGSRLNPKVIGYDTSNFAPNAVKIVVDIDETELNKFKSFDYFKLFKLDLNYFFDSLKDCNMNFCHDEWLTYIKNKRFEESLVLEKHRNLKDYVSTYVFSETLEKFLKDDSIIVTSDGTAHVVLHKTVRLRSQQQLFSNEGTAPMGYGLPAAIGAYYGCKKPIICIEGDGSMMMNLQELQTCKHHNLPIKIFILNNDGYLSIKLTQSSFFKGNLVASESSSGVSLPSYEKISNAFDIKYTAIKNNSELYKLVDVFKSDDLEIVEIFTDPYELHEPKVSAKGIDQNGKIIPGSLEDIK